MTLVEMLERERELAPLTSTVLTTGPVQILRQINKLCELLNLPLDDSACRPQTSDPGEQRQHLPSSQNLSYQVSSGHRQPHRSPGFIYLDDGVELRTIANTLEILSSVVAQRNSSYEALA